MALSDADKLNRIRRFYKDAAAGPVGGGFGVLLDGRAAKTPAGGLLVVPTLSLAEQLAGEWAAAGESIDFAALPATRLAFTVVDRAAAVHADVAATIARQAAADALCYLAEGPPSLVARQRTAWGPMLDWAAARGWPLAQTAGVLHQPQPDETLAAIRAHAEALDGFRLFGLAHAAGLYESAILALAVEQGAATAEDAFELSRLEEVFQIEQWGLDSEAEARIEGLRREAAMLGRWFAALG